MSDRQHSPPASSEKFDRLKDLLRAMFQLDRGDLDFGLYRIMNLKAAEIEAFLENDLLPQVKSVLAGMADDERAALFGALAEAREKAWELQVDPDESPTVVELKRKLAEAKADAAAEADVYNHLANFFARYYAEGDFISQRRYSGGGRSAYLIPYDGEEVKLHWANQDQYYVKSTENYASYIFSVGRGQAARRVRFEIEAADSEKDNIKETSGKQRRFVLTIDKGAVSLEGRDLVVRFEHRPLTEREKKAWPGNGSRQQDRINKSARQSIFKVLRPDWLALLAAPAPTETHPDRSVLDKHLAVYTAKNSFDYFIHKDLGGFLRRELDFYLKNEVLNLDDLAMGEAARLNRALARTRAVRQVADKIITFLAQLEDFQKQLWLKKKFVLETQWCVTLDRVPEALFSEIIANDAQLQEWVKLFAIDKIEGDLANGNSGYSEPLTLQFLKTNPYLVLDTRHFDRTFTDRLVAALSDAGPLEDQSDGLLVHGENFQALNLLQARYQGQVQCIYIDPPYNTDASAILYKNNYKDSSWLSLMAGRLSLARNCLANDGILCVAIDDVEFPNLQNLLSNSYGDDSILGTVAVRSNPAGRSTPTGFSSSHEYALFASKITGAEIGRLPRTKKQIERYKEADEIGRFEWVNFRKHGGFNAYRTARPKLFYPLYVGRKIRIPEMVWIESSREWHVEEDIQENEIAVWPINDIGEEKTWKWGRETVERSLSELRAKLNRSGQMNIYVKSRVKKEGTLPTTWWDDKKYSAAEHGTRTLANLFGDARCFSFPKSPHLVEDCLRASLCDSRSTVLDYFAGSGTTGHAIINLNREDGGRRKYILVEVGHHFDAVLLPRIKKVVYSSDWKEGQPVSRNGSTQCFQYIRMESYEDTLDGLELIPPSDTQKSLLAGNAGLAEDYRLRYALGQETSESACLLGKHFTNPFAYTLSVVRDGVRREPTVDLPETFNFLIGLHLESRRRIDSVLAIAGTDAQGRKCLILWRNLSETDNTALDAWFLRNRAQFADSLDLVYVNGDHTLNALKQPNESWTANTIEPVFRELMFGGGD